MLCWSTQEIEGKRFQSSHKSFGGAQTLVYLQAPLSLVTPENEQAAFCTNTGIQGPHPRRAAREAGLLSQAKVRFYLPHSIPSSEAAAALSTSVLRTLTCLYRQSSAVECAMREAWHCRKQKIQSRLLVFDRENLHGLGQVPYLMANVPVFCLDPTLDQEMEV